MNSNLARKLVKLQVVLHHNSYFKVLFFVMEYTYLLKPLKLHNFITTFDGSFTRSCFPFIGTSKTLTYELPRCITSLQYAASAYEGERRIKELVIRKIMDATSFELAYNFYEALYELLTDNFLIQCVYCIFFLDSLHSSQSYLLSGEILIWRLFRRKVR